MAIIKQPSCDDPIEPALLPVAEAMRRMAELMPALHDTETVATEKAANRVLAESVISPINVPAATNSAMDGFAIQQSDIPSSGERALKIVGEAYAGRMYSKALQDGEAVRIFTGAVMPEGSDTVVIQEHVAVDKNLVTIDNKVQAGKNVRHVGEDLTIGDTVLKQGRQLTAADVGLLASLGIKSVQVTRQLVVAFFSTGDEVQALENATSDGLPDGMVYDSNRHTKRPVKVQMLLSPPVEFLQAMQTMSPKPFTNWAMYHSGSWPCAPAGLWLAVKLVRQRFLVCLEIRLPSW